jgi:hypothetical protein
VWATVAVSEVGMALRKALVLFALGVSASLLMGCSARLQQCDPANICHPWAALSQLKARSPPFARLEMLTAERP